MNADYVNGLCVEIMGRIMISSVYSLVETTDCAKIYASP